jgi:hypothetical protein
MKTRSGFVANSSSSSFVVNKRYLTTKEIKILLQYKNPENGYWVITDSGNSIIGRTSMDNGYLRKYLKEKGLIKDPFKWDITEWRDE